MTIACALKTDTGVWIGADSRLTMRSGFVLPVESNKWMPLHSGLWWAFSGHTRVESVVAKLPLVDTPEEFQEAVRAAVKEDGWNSDADKGETVDYAYDLLLVTPERVCFSHGSGSFADFGDAFCAIGSGREYAYGAAFALRGMDPEVIVRTAVEAAIAFDTSCGGAVSVEFIPNGQ